MSVHWLVEAGVFRATAPRILAALDQLGCPWTNYEDGIPMSALPPEDACVLFWGSLGAAYGERVAAGWTPGAIGDPDAFRCSVYRAHLGPLLANHDCVFTTVRALVDDPAAAVKPLGSPGRVFVRPDCALKPFSGRTADLSSLTLAALDHGYYYDDEELPVLVSPAKAIGREWRFVVADRQVVAGCEYDAERRGQRRAVPEPARALAEAIAGLDWQAAPLYIVDVGEVLGSMKVLELNPFSGADFYECDAPALVAAATRVARRLYQLIGPAPPAARADRG